MAKAYLVETALGILALDENLNVIDVVPFERDAEKVARKLMDIEKGVLVEEEKKLIEKLIEKGYKDFVVEDDELARNIARTFPDVNVSVEKPSKAGKYVRSNMEEIAKKYFNVEPKELREFLFQVGDLMSRLKVRAAAEKRDLFIAQAIAAIDDIDKTVNLFASRIREWYGLHFPELDDLVRDHRDYIKLVYHLGHRDNFKKDKIVELLGISEQKAAKIEEAAKRSVGADMADWDIEAIRMVAKEVLDLVEVRKKLTEYIDEAMKEVAPNIRELVGPLLGARLIRLAGGLMKLAMLPASTIQVLGAEKALFRALRTGGKPPKHGVIFQFPAIFRAPRWQRGKIARALAAKLAIAARVDAFTGQFIAPKLKEELMKRIEEIKKLYPKPPKREKKEEAKAAPRRRRRARKK